MSEESTAEMPTAEMPTDPLLDVGNIQPAVAEDASSAADSGAVYGALLVEEILTEAEVKNTPTIAAVMLKEVHNVRYWEYMELQDVRAVDAVPNVTAALIRRATVRGLAMRGLIAKGCVEAARGRGAGEGAECEVGRRGGQGDGRTAVPKRGPCHWLPGPSYLQGSHDRHG